jgi:hypothetical protein
VQVGQPAPDLERDPLGLTADQMRDLGYRTVDMLVAQLSRATAPAIRRPASCTAA